MNGLCRCVSTALGNNKSYLQEGIEAFVQLSVSGRI
jgi:hypothetical protein